MSPASIFAGILDPRIAVHECALSNLASAPYLFPQEEAAMAAAVPRRRLEYATGRACARAAMAALGSPPVSLPSQPDRLPMWPAAFVGSITHTDDFCAAAVARRDDGFAAIGIDAEPLTPLPEELWDFVSSAEERAAAGPDIVLTARLLFSAKEAAFKAQYAISRQMLEFSDLAVAIDPASASFTATLRRKAGSFAPGTRLHGRYSLAQDTAPILACAVVLRADEI